MEWEIGYVEIELDELLEKVYTYMAEHGMLDELIEKYGGVIYESNKYRRTGPPG